ncbi:hypothetical protein QQS21_011833 [Conoideocrella luteorostrata]|uniref:Homeobox domain-containing protein n=1 Tax=Conoideocrella luteorostrata TaxID=1105319 RepID=A0AAJ0CCE3_9HYPO|nr:hypothetical protein QQS21_011833 [Conoideocrella luteorostrata]
MAIEMEHHSPLANVNQAPASASEGDAASPPPFTRRSSARPSSGNHSQPNLKRLLGRRVFAQPQKRQKRRRVTPDQLTILEEEFCKNAKPTAANRERIADEVNMTKQSVQIWFQNRRAKVKWWAKKNLETCADFNSIPEYVKAYMALEATETGNGLVCDYPGRAGLIPVSHNSVLFGGNQAEGTVLTHHLTCRSLRIGKWIRVRQHSIDLSVSYSPQECTMTYYINNEQARYKVEYPFWHIKNIWLENRDSDPNTMGGIVIELNRAPFFFTDLSSETGSFYEVGDFTEDLQATQCNLHRIEGNPTVLANQLAELVSLDSFINRHILQHYATAVAGDPHTLSLSAPVSAITQLGSQHNDPQPRVNMLQGHWGVGQTHSSWHQPHGHRRQRSRSVPDTVDLTTSRNQSTLLSYDQPQGEMKPHHNENKYAPVPQQSNDLRRNLRIDTDAGFGLDMSQYPVLATATPLSDFSFSPTGTYQSQGPEGEPLSAASFGTPYCNGAFGFPMVDTESSCAAISPIPPNASSGPFVA